MLDVAQILIYYTLAFTANTASVGMTYLPATSNRISLKEAKSHDYTGTNLLILLFCTSWGKYLILLHQ